MSGAAAARPRVAVRLAGVPETMLWPLWNRGAEARRPDRILDDPLAVELVERIDYDFKGHFGGPHVSHAARAMWCDRKIRAFLQRHPDAVVAALGDGLETQLWRVDNGRVLWLSIDLPESIAVRRQLLPAHERNVLIERSALDPAWLDAVPAERPVFVTAAGLFMYLREADVVGLLRLLAARFPGGELFFDCIPAWLSAKTMRGWHVTRRYTTPPMPFGLDLGEIGRFAAQVPGLVIREAIAYPEACPARMRVFALMSHIPWFRDRVAPGLVHAAFAS